jgi:branched-chain amino acid transport system ATP-binding protein
MYKPTSGQVRSPGRCCRPKPRKVAKAGVARTFQNIRLFHNMTALENVMVGRYCRTKTPPLDAILHGPKFRREEAETREVASNGWTSSGWGHHRTPEPQPALRRPAPPGDRPGLGHWSPSCCCWTSRRRA